MIAVTLDEWKKKLESPNREVIILHNPKVSRASVVTSEDILGLFVLFLSNGFVPMAFHSSACTRGEGNGSRVCQQLHISFQRLFGQRAQASTVWYHPVSPGSCCSQSCLCSGVTDRLFLFPS